MLRGALLAYSRFLEPLDKETATMPSGLRHPDRSGYSLQGPACASIMSG